MARKLVPLSETHGRKIENANITNEVILRNLKARSNRLIQITQI
jgi:hypothetical protein